VTIPRKTPLKRSSKPIKRSPIARKSGKPKRFRALLCTRHHREQHTLGIRSFEADHQIDLKAEALRLATLWENT